MQLPVHGVACMAAMDPLRLRHEQQRGTWHAQMACAAAHGSGGLRLAPILTPGGGPASLPRRPAR